MDQLLSKLMVRYYDEECDVVYLSELPNFERTEVFSCCYNAHYYLFIFSHYLHIWYRDTELYDISSIFNKLEQECRVLMPDKMFTLDFNHNNDDEHHNGKVMIVKIDSPCIVQIKHRLYDIHDLSYMTQITQIAKYGGILKVKSRDHPFYTITPDNIEKIKNDLYYVKVYEKVYQVSSIIALPKIVNRLLIYEYDKNFRKIAIGYFQFEN